MREAPKQYDPDLTEKLLEEGDKRLDESRRLLDDLGARVPGAQDTDA